MKLIRVKIENFRCYKDEVAVDIGDVTALIGKNDAGKSAILDALNIFFENSKLDEDDANKDGDKTNVRIVCEFSGLPPTIVLDATNSTKLTDEYLLNESGNLEIVKVYNGSLRTPKPKGTFARASHPSAENVGDLLTLKKADLKKRSDDLGVDISQIDKRVNAQVRQEIWNATGDLKLQTKEIPLDAEDAKKIWEQLKKELPVFSLFKSDRTSTDQDDEAQDPMKAAIAEALKSKETELEEISKHVQREVETIAKETVEKLREMDPTLASELKPRFSPPSWKNVFKITLTDEDQISMNKRGSGVRRLILLNFFRAKAEQKASEGNAPGIIYAIEEPETSQHPNNQKMLMDAFADLADESNRQVILSTHTPMLARTLPADSLRYIEVRDDNTRMIHAKDEETISLVAKALGVLPDHNVKLFIGVEGNNDINFLREISQILNASDDSIPNLYELETQDKVIFFPMGGNNLAHWVSKKKPLNVPEYYIVDSDITESGEVSPNQQKVNETNAEEHCEAVLTNKREMENYLHPEAIKAARPAVDIEFGDFDDVPGLAAAALEQKQKTAKKWLNGIAVEKMTPELLDERDPDGELKGWLKRIAQLIDGTT